ncbi:MAG: nuclear transport factor 2 family protein [Arenibacterium sp.]
MIRSGLIIAATTTSVALSGIAFAASSAEDAARLAHDRYLAAINANDPVAFLATVTEDIVFIAPNAPAMVGKAEVEPWVRGYFDAMETTWEKTSLEFVVSGGWAFERYSYTSVESPRDGGGASIETGNGINIYRRGTDDVWRVARDVWATDGSSLDTGPITDPATCVGATSPC